MVEVADDRHVTVVMPVHDREETLREAARSVLTQSHRDLTLVIVDDASSDGSVTVAERLEDPRVRILRATSWIGPCRARNLGIEHASGRYLAFMDSDDRWLPQKLERQLDHLVHLQTSDASVGIVGCGWRYLGGGPARGFTPGPFTRTDVLYRRVNGVGTPMLLLDRRRVDAEARFDPAFAALEENDYLLSSMSGCSTLRVLPEVLVEVRRGRDDHAANSWNAARSYVQYLEKYAHEIADRPALRSWLAFRASRESLLHGDARTCASLLAPALRFLPGRRALHLVAAALGGRRGLALAQRVAPMPTHLGRGER
jgi:glycosyltransferase involved in cell wall biosynthesis